MKTFYAIFVVTVLSTSVFAQVSDTLKVSKSCATLTFEESMRPNSKPEAFVFTPIADTLLFEWSKWKSVSSKPIAIRKVVNDTIFLTFADTGKVFLTMDCYEINKVKLPKVFTSKNEVVVSLSNKYFTVSNLTTGIEDKNESNEVLFFPNPVRSQVFIKDNQYASIVVTNSLGQKVIESSASVSFLDFGSLEIGIYYLTFVSDKGTVTKMVYKQ